MADPYPLQKFDDATPEQIETALESSEVVYFERCPVALPTETEREFLRNGLPQQLRLKNVSYHPESDSVPGFEAPADVTERVARILREHRSAVGKFLEAHLPNLAPDWTLGTTSFRAIEESGRGLKPRSSSEIVHIDAGAYGATNGNRILRFFVNLNPEVDRVWGTKGSFRALFEKHAAFPEAARGKRDRINIEKGILDHCFSGFVNGLSRVYPLAKVVDSSPYDRAMRRIHNYMKESIEFRSDEADYREIRFPPLSAWMVFTDGISHSVVSGRHALITTILVPLENCRLPEFAPFNILAAAS
ncbi:MAG TPA: Kdo hydroxylase family protein [Gammaproteobacteria bacterium]